MEDRRQRRLTFEGAINFRDLGGYPAGAGRRTRWHRLYRSDSLADLTPGDLDHLAALDLRTLIDFRLPEERLAKPDRLPAGAAITTLELGFVPRGTLEMLRLVREGSIGADEISRRVIAQYRLFPLEHQGEYRRLAELAIKRSTYPLLIHCTSGKDRTGYGIAVLLLAAGVARETVIEDYLLTNRYRRAVPQLLGPGTPEAAVHRLLAAQPDYLEAALDAAEQAFGSLDAYFAQALCLDDKARDALALLLTEPDGVVA